MCPAAARARGGDRDPGDPVGARRRARIARARRRQDTSAGSIRSNGWPTSMPSVSASSADRPPSTAAQNRPSAAVGAPPASADLAAGAGQYRCRWNAYVGSSTRRPAGSTAVQSTRAPATCARPSATTTATAAGTPGRSSGMNARPVPLGTALRRLALRRRPLPPPRGRARTGSVRADSMSTLCRTARAASASANRTRPAGRRRPVPGSGWSPAARRAHPPRRSAGRRAPAADATWSSSPSTGSISAEWNAWDTRSILVRAPVAALARTAATAVASPDSTTRGRAVDRRTDTRSLPRPRRRPCSAPHRAHGTARGRLCISRARAATSAHASSRVSTPAANAAADLAHRVAGHRRRDDTRRGQHGGEARLHGEQRRLSVQRLVGAGVVAPSGPQPSADLGHRHTEQTSSDPARLVKGSGEHRARGVQARRHPGRCDP